MPKICRDVEVKVSYAVAEPGSDKNFFSTALASYEEALCVDDQGSEKNMIEFNNLIHGYCYGDARPLQKGETNLCAVGNEYVAKATWFKKAFNVLNEMLGNI